MADPAFSRAELALHTRQQAVTLIEETLWPLDTKVGRALLLEVVAEMGIAALSDDAVKRLAYKESAFDNLTGTPEGARRRAALLGQPQERR